MLWLQVAHGSVAASHLEVSQQSFRLVDEVHLSRHLPAKTLHKESPLYDAMVCGCTLQDGVRCLPKQREDAVSSIFNNLILMLHLQSAHVWRLDERCNGNVATSVVVAVVADGTVDAVG